MAVGEKPWWQSTTLWINVAGVVALGLDYIVRMGTVQDADIIAIILALVNIIRRFQVQSPVKKLTL